MVPTQSEILLGRIMVGTTVAVAPTAIPTWGPPAVELFGATIPIASMALALLGLVLARMVSNAREGKTPGGHALTGLLIVVIIGIVIERQPGPGIAAAYGMGIGAAGIATVELVKGWFLTKAKLLFGPGKDKL